MHVFSWDLSIPWTYHPKTPGDDVWQLALTKTLVDNGWILNNKYLGAPGIAHWYSNPAAQTSSLHSVLMLILSFFIHDAVKLQQVYFLLNFPLIALTSFLACRLLGVARLPAAAVGLLYCFITYRFNYDIYAYLGNFFMIPLAMVPVYWTIRGDYAAEADRQERPAWRVKDILTSRKFALGTLFVILMALSDGYYAFFTLLLLGYAVATRVVCGDWRRPSRLLAPVLQIVIVMSVALVMMLPLMHYKSSHISEFYPHGVEDPALVRHPFEAEVYATNLKLMLAPGSGHRVPALASLGKRMLDSTNAARKYAVGNIAPLGFLGSLLLAMSFVGLLWALFGDGRRSVQASDLAGSVEGSVRASIGLSLFIFLCATAGGIGSLIALVYPSIRAYERFGAFLIFVLYVGGAAVLSVALSHLRARGRGIALLLLGLVCVLSLFDQIPRATSGANEASRATFVAERAFVHRIERQLPEGAMVYNYPYSQYLSDSKYYGWGSFDQYRLYLHSKALHWSNGASKNAPVDLWHARMASLPPAQLLIEMEAAGFRGIVIDRTVVKDDEYHSVAAAIQRVTGTRPVSDAASELAFAALKDPGYRLTYNSSFTRVERMTITDRKLMLANPISRYVNRHALEKLLASTDTGDGKFMVESSVHPDMFPDASTIDRGRGGSAIQPLSDLKGALQCEAQGSGANERVDIRVTNNSSFDWDFNEGSFPISIGVNLYSASGDLVSWDRGIRLPGAVQVGQREAVAVAFPVKLIEDKLQPSEHKAYQVQFRLVQDGNAWFNTVDCRVPLNL